MQPPGDSRCSPDLTRTPTSLSLPLQLACVSTAGACRSWSAGTRATSSSSWSRSCRKPERWAPARGQRREGKVPMECWFWGVLGPAWGVGKGHWEPLTFLFQQCLGIECF